MPATLSRLSSSRYCRACGYCQLSAINPAMLSPTKNPSDKHLFEGYFSVVLGNEFDPYVARFERQRFAGLVHHRDRRVQVFLLPSAFGHGVTVQHACPTPAFEDSLG